MKAYRSVTTGIVIRAMQLTDYTASYKEMRKAFPEVELTLGADELQLRLWKSGEVHCGPTTCYVARVISGIPMVATGEVLLIPDHQFHKAFVECER